MIMNLIYWKNSWNLLNTKLVYINIEYCINALYYFLKQIIYFLMVLLIESYKFGFGNHKTYLHIQYIFEKDYTPNH